MTETSSSPVFLRTAKSWIVSLKRAIVALLENTTPLQLQQMCTLVHNRLSSSIIVWYLYILLHFFMAAFAVITWICFFVRCWGVRQGLATVCWLVRYRAVSSSSRHVAACRVLGGPARDGDLCAAYLECMHAKWFITCPLLLPMEENAGFQITHFFVTILPFLKFIFN